MFARLFPIATEMIKKWGTETMDPTDGEATSVVEEHPDYDQESAECEEAAGSAASELVPIQSGSYLPTINLPGNEISTAGLGIEIEACERNVEVLVSSLNLVPPLFMYPEAEGTHHINGASVSAYLLMDFMMQKGMNLSHASQL